MEHLFDIEIAEKYGVNSAIIYRHFQFWIAKNKAESRNFHNGRTWSYNTLDAIQRLFPYMTIWAVRMALSTLLKSKVLRKGRYNKKGFDRTNWYAFEDENTALAAYKSHLCNSQMADEKLTNGSCEYHKSICESHKPIPDTIPNTKPDNINTDNNRAVKSSESWILDLDRCITEQRNFFIKQIEKILRPGPRSAKTIAKIAYYFVTSAQQKPENIAWFKDAVEWARSAKAANVKNHIGLFVSKVKEQTGYSKEKYLLNNPQRDGVILTTELARQLGRVS